ncbi:Leucine-rich repeat domain superfamily [Sesbania bispinosa]|nr:Leucine-rich repeat domain superfamily [Sesbania bispinosa]
MVELDLGSMDMNALSKQAIGGQSKLDGQSQSKLEISHLVNYDIESLPSCFKNLTRLQYLDIRYFQELETSPELPLSLEILLAQECRSLETVFFPSVADQFKENRNKVVFSNCLKLDEDSLMAIGLNAQINVMKFHTNNYPH